MLKKYFFHIFVGCVLLGVAGIVTVSTLLKSAAVSTRASVRVDPASIPQGPPPPPPGPNPWTLNNPPPPPPPQPPRPPRQPQPVPEAFIEIPESEASKPTAPVASVPLPLKPAPLAPEIVKIISLNGVQLKDAKQVAKALDIPAQAVQAETTEARTALISQFSAVFAPLTAAAKAVVPKDTGGASVVSSPQEISFQPLASSLLVQTLSTVVAAAGVKNPELSSLRGKEGFVRDIAVIMGGEALQKAQNNLQKVEIIAETTVSIALGQPLDRRTMDKAFPELGKALLLQEQKVIKQGIFQKIFNDIPRTTQEWQVVKKIAYRAREPKRDLSREIEARERYEQVEKVKIAKLAKSKKPQDQAKVAEAWSVIRAVAGSGLAIPRLARAPDGQGS